MVFFFFFFVEVRQSILFTVVSEAHAGGEEGRNDTLYEHDTLI